jgi:small-conductance mechanosensitive channel
MSRVKRAKAFIELNFGYEAEVNKTIAVLDEVLFRVPTDPLVSRHLLDKPEIIGWNQFSEWAVVVSMSSKVIAGEQGDVARVMRQYAVKALQGSV